MIELRENSIAIVHKGLGYDGKEHEELVVRNWNNGYASEIEIVARGNKCSMNFKVDEFIALAEIFKQLKENRR